jgi:hypothetical protein
MRIKKAARSRKAAARKPMAHAAQVVNRMRHAIGKQTIAVRVLAGAGIFVFGAALLVAARRPDSSPAVASIRAEEGALAAAAITSGAASLEATADAAFPKSEAVTITGCLEQRDETFRLKNTAGDGAPKSRNWKSGFLKKSTSAVDVVDSKRRLKLPAHVGERVTITGVMMNREMQARSLQRVGATCN